MDYKGLICPVCNNRFENSDNIVVCPECGTPHHRECYFENGKCANENLHITGFEFNKTTVKDDAGNNEETETVKEEIFFSDKDTQEEFEKFQNMREEEQNTYRGIADDINNKSSEQFFIDGKKASYYEAAIGKNQKYYIPRFLVIDRTGKKAVVNFFAFLFPFAWSLYRKLYKISAAVLAFYILVFGVTVLPVVSNQNYMDAVNKVITSEGYDALYNIVAYGNGEDVQLTKDEVALIEAANESQMPSVLYYTIQLSMFAVKILISLFGTKMYLDSLKKKINRAFTFNFNEEGIKAYLKSKAGVVPVVIAVIASIADISALL